MTDETTTRERLLGTTSASALIPPYIAYSTFKTFLSELKTNSFPPQIDRSVLKRFSFGIQGQLKSAIRSMGLVDGDKPTPKLRALVDAYETETFGAILGDLLRSVYPYVFALDLMTATPTMFADAFKETGAKEDVARKCRTFFLHAAKDAGIVLGARLSAAGATRGSGNGNRPRKAKVLRAAVPREEGNNPQGAGGSQEDRDRPPEIFDRLLDKFPTLDPAWPDEIKTKWFDSFDTLMERATKT